MIIDNQIVVAIRINDFNGKSFIAEHKKLIKTNGYVWILKVGRPLAAKAVDILTDNKLLLLKEPKKNGGKSYICEVEDVQEGDCLKLEGYPLYYWELEKNGISLNGTWFKVKSITEIPDEAVKRFVLAKSEKSMSEVFNCTRSPLLYVKVFGNTSVEL